MIRTSLVLASVCVLGGALSAQQPTSAPTLSAAEKTGRSIFQTRCAMCHVGQAPAAELASAAAPRSTTLGPLLSKANASNEAALRQTIKDGSGRMPAYKYSLTDEQVEQVIAFMKTLDRPLTRIFAARAGE